MQFAPSHKVLNFFGGLEWIGLCGDQFYEFRLDVNWRVFDELARAFVSCLISKLPVCLRSCLNFEVPWILPKLVGMCFCYLGMKFVGS